MNYLLLLDLFISFFTTSSITLNDNFIAIQNNFHEIILATNKESNKQYTKLLNNKLQNNVIILAENSSPDNSNDKNSEEKPESKAIEDNIQLEIIKSITTMIASIVLGSILIATIPAVAPPDFRYPQKAIYLKQAYSELSRTFAIILIVSIIFVLTLFKQIESSGTISIFSAIIGYVLGTKTSKDNELIEVIETETPENIKKLKGEINELKNEIKELKAQLQPEEENNN